MSSLPREKYDESQSVILALRRISHATDTHSKLIERQTGLSLPQRIVLDSVANLGETTTGQLSSAVSLSQATVTTILDRLEAKGLVERYRSRADRRIVHTRLTEDGKRALAACHQTPYDEFLRRLRSLDSEGQLRLGAAAREIAALLEESLPAGARSAQQPRTPHQPAPKTLEPEA